ncbi:MAG: class I SAM-dependent methyltransferase [Solirubrobacterales bacterium]
MSAQDKPPFPPLDLADRVSSLPETDNALDHFEWLGLMTRQSIDAALPEDWNYEGKRLLDFGCGSGRTLRHFLDVAEVAEAWGCDIDRPSIEWLEDNLCPPLRVFTCEVDPPLKSDRPGLEAGSFDLIWAVSVFTHLAGNSAEWLLELHRLLKPGGILIASFMGRLTHQPLTGEPWDERGTGMKAIGLDNPWEKGGPSVFMSDWWVREHWGRAFEVEIIDAGVETLNQSWAVMKKKPVELTPAELLAEKPRRWWRRG